MKLLCILLFAVAAAAQTCTTCKVSMKPEPRWITDTTRIADAHHLRWNVQCTSLDGKYKFVARAYRQKDSLAAEDALYLEQGAVPHWFAFGETQQLAVAGLRLVMLQPPNNNPEHAPVYKQKKQCDTPPIRRGYGGTQ